MSEEMIKNYEVDVVIKRGAETKTVKVKLEKRN